MAEVFPILFFIATLAFLLLGFPVAFTLSGTAILFAGIGTWTGHFDSAYLAALPERLFGIMTNEALVAIPLFVFMGVILERSRIAENLLETMSQAFGGFPGGLGLSVCLVGGLLAASTGIVGATVVTMGLISLPAMLKRGYSPSLSTGVICASGTLGQIIPPSIVLVILGDMIGSAHQQAQLNAGNFAPTAVSVADLFAGAMIPGVLLMGFYMVWIFCVARVKPDLAPPIPVAERMKRLDPAFARRLVSALFPPLILVMGVLGSILTGIATPTEAASVGGVGALILAGVQNQLTMETLREAARSTLQITAMVFTILIGASLFSLVFRGFGGDDLIRHYLETMTGGPAQSLLIVMAVIFVLGFFLDFFEIVFVVVPIVGPILLGMGFHPVWLGVLIAMNLQTSFLTPPFGFALFYLRGVTPKEVSTTQIYRGVIPFIGLQILMLVLLWFFPGWVTWLPSALFGTE